MEINQIQASRLVVSIFFLENLPFFFFNLSVVLMRLIAMVLHTRYDCKIKLLSIIYIYLSVRHEKSYLQYSCIEQNLVSYVVKPSLFMRENQILNFLEPKSITWPNYLLIKDFFSPHFVTASFHRPSWSPPTRPSGSSHTVPNFHLEMCLPQSSTLLLFTKFQEVLFQTVFMCIKLNAKRELGS